MPEFNDILVELIKTSPMVAVLIIIVKYLIDMINKLMTRLDADDAKRLEDVKIHAKQNELLQKMLMQIDGLNNKTDVVDKVKEMLRDERK